MKTQAFEQLACPIDGLALEKQDKQLLCANKHCFDIAKQGYSNLLPVQYKRSKQPGDSKEMVDARQRFLNSGIYQPISHAVNECILEHQMRRSQSELSESDLSEFNFAVLDAGCGEGYYLQQLKMAGIESSHQGTLSLLGIDIAKPAILAAAKREKNDISWSVASNRNLPIAAQSIDIILCMFGFPVFEQFQKVLKANGAILLVESGPHHLVELREKIYDEVRISDVPIHQKALELGFQIQEYKELRYQSSVLTEEQLHDLLIMTPHFYKAPAAKKADIATLKDLTLTIDVRLRLMSLQNIQ